ncbi:hypothetical protein GGS26DRAFT_604063 [Hypomontagnella submonticulosa]|nr:hypothetical protein GGS26DRAFT_604063 [Hypomontagnella submonticulosa]
MPFINRFVALMGLLALSSNPGSTQAIPMTYCASINTASMSGNSSIYQSDGLCHDFCFADFAFAVIKDSQCWCSNYEPDKSVQAEVSKCSKGCPGFPSDTCGGDGLWGYMSLDKKPSGTKGTSSSTMTPVPDPITKTVQNTVTVVPPVHSTTAVPDSSSKTTAGSSTTPPPIQSFATVTEGGTVKTIYVTPTSVADTNTSPDANSSGMTTSQHGLSAGAAAGIAIGVLAAVGIAVGAGFFFFFRRRRRQEQVDAIADSPGSHRGSSAGMMSTPTTAMASVWDGDNASSGRRNSRFMPHDPRMDPYAVNIYSRFDNKSHESINTLQDNHDYSRKVLRTTNPDPPNEE